MRTPIVVGNWKMNGLSAESGSLAAATAAAAASLSLDVGVAPPALWLAQTVAACGDHCSVFAQDVSAHSSGAHTGEVSAAMLKDLGAAGAIVGHSERRAQHSESNELVGAKVKALLAEGLHAIVCVGEHLDDRAATRTWAVIEAQLIGALASLSATQLQSIVIAYEPVWAIGTGLTASPEQAQEVHAQIRTWVSENIGATAADAVRIQYGGSVKPGNAASLMSQPDVDGALVGGASLSGETFGLVLAACE
ncbi:MAG: triosephosphate isomerase [Bradymonadia bacterium]|jgi:triosephosphate isomerase